MKFADHKIKLPAAKAEKVAPYDGKTVVFGVRPEDIHDEEMFISNSPESVVEATVNVYELLGADVNLYLQLSEEIDFVANVNARTTAKRDDVIQVAIDTSKIHVFDKETEQVITN